ncbi:MAG: hypothetical protein RL701_2271 [Pseudomonadota bacterium]|jgi:hypothetical protein
MKDFIRPSGRLRGLPFAARLTYSVFLLFTLLALAESAWLGADMVGANLSGLAAYYAGESSPVPAPAEPSAADGGGPTLDLPSDLPTTAPSDPMPLRKLLEVTHFHLFTMPVYLMVLAHLFMLSRWGQTSKVFWISGGTLGVGTHIAAPWVARSGAAEARIFYAFSGSLLLGTFLVMSLVPLYEMWAARVESKHR